MISSGEDSKQSPIKLQSKYPHLGRALDLICSETIRERMMGYALITTCYHLCPEEVRGFILDRWKNEEVKKGIKKEFVEYCIKRFGA